MAFKFPMAKSPSGWRSAFSLSPSMKNVNTETAKSALESPIKSHSQLQSVQSDSASQHPEYSSTLSSFETINDKVLREMNERASRLVVNKRPLSEDEDSLEADAQQQMHSPKTSLAATAAAAISRVRHTPRSGRRGHQRFSSIHQRQFAKMDSIATHHAVKAHGDHGKVGSSLECSSENPAPSASRFLSASSASSVSNGSIRDIFNDDMSSSPMKKRKTGFSTALVSKSPDKENQRGPHLVPEKKLGQNYQREPVPIQVLNVSNSNKGQCLEVYHTAKDGVPPISPRLMRPLPRVSGLTRMRAQRNVDSARGNVNANFSTSREPRSLIPRTAATRTETPNTKQTPVGIRHSVSTRSLSSRPSKSNLGTPFSTKPSGAPQRSGATTKEGSDRTNSTLPTIRHSVSTRNLSSKPSMTRLGVSHNTKSSGAPQQSGASLKEGPERVNSTTNNHGPMSRVRSEQHLRNWATTERAASPNSRRAHTSARPNGANAYISSNFSGNSNSK